MSTLSQGADRFTSLFADLLAELFRPPSVVLRNDLTVRGLEGLPRQEKMLLGDPPGRFEILEGDIRYWGAPWTGHKTGARARITPSFSPSRRIPI